MTIEEAKGVKQNSKVIDVRTGEIFEFIVYDSIIDEAMIAIFPGMQVYWIKPEFLKLI